MSEDNNATKLPATAEKDQGPEADPVLSGPEADQSVPDSDADQEVQLEEKPKMPKRQMHGVKAKLSKARRDIFQLNQSIKLKKQDVKRLEGTVKDSLAEKKELQKKNLALSKKSKT